MYILFTYYQLAPHQLSIKDIQAQKSNVVNKHSYFQAFSSSLCPRAKARAAGGVASELEELSQQYEDIMEDCGHGKFQWTLFMVLGLALMADGVECFVVAFVLPSAEKDLCLSNAEKGMLGKRFNYLLLLSVW